MIDALKKLQMYNVIWYFLQIKCFPLIHTIHNDFQFINISIYDSFRSVHSYITENTNPSNGNCPALASSQLVSTTENKANNNPGYLAFAFILL